MSQLKVIKAEKKAAEIFKLGDILANINTQILYHQKISKDQVYHSKRKAQCTLEANKTLLTINNSKAYISDFR